MKKLAFLFTALLTTQVLASGSFGVRGGGNTCVEHFINYGKAIHGNVTNLDYDREKFLDKVKTAEIVEVQTEMVLWENNQYIAMNEPSANRIYLSQKWCRESRLPFQNNKTALIAFHEILGLSEPGRDKNYEISSKIYQSSDLSEEEFYNLAMTDGLDRKIIQSDTYTYARPSESYPHRAVLQLSENNYMLAASIDCSSSFAKGADGNYVMVPPLLVILGHKAEYKFAYTKTCEDLLDFLKFRNFQNVKVAFLVGTTSSTIYEVITK